MLPYRYPPRPEKAIPVDLIQFYENMNWIAQRKLNGSCTVIGVNSKGNPTFWNRHNEVHKAWTPTEHIIEYFKQYPDSYFIGELLHNKHSSVKNTMYLFDFIKLNDKDYVGSKLKERLNILSEMPKTENLWIAKTYTSKFRDLFDEQQTDIDEGIVLKNPEATLKPCIKDGMNANWQIKVRRLTKNFGF